jgi:hypothetical protein
MSDTDAGAESRVYAILARFTSRRLSGSDASLRVEEDLGITGEDAADLMRAISTELEVDLDEFLVLRHFGPEAFGPWLFGKPAAAKEYGCYPVTVGHLVSVAVAGRWFDPPRVERSSTFLEKLFGRSRGTPG